MAKRSYLKFFQQESSLIKSSLGFLALAFILSLIFLALYSIFSFSFSEEASFSLDNYLRSVIYFSFYQALLSTILSLFFAIILAKALYNLDFYGKKLILKILGASFFLPSLLVISGIFIVYGKNGILAQIFAFFSWNYKVKIYGLFGILLAHVFLNFPFATKIIYQSLEGISSENRKTAELLGWKFWQNFKFLEAPIILRQSLPLFGLIFMLCFSSFAIVLTLGASPKFTTIELAIYQAIRDFDLKQAGILALIQLFIGLLFLLILTFLSSKKNLVLSFKGEKYKPKISKKAKFFSFLSAFLLLTFVFSPLLALIFQALKNFSLTFLKAEFFQAFFTSLFIAFSSAALAMFLALLIIISNNNLRKNSKNFLSSLLLLFSSSPLALPNMIISSGFFIFFYSYFGSSKFIILLLIVLSNTLLALPFIIKQLAFPSLFLSEKTKFLCEILGINFFSYLKIIEFSALKKLYLYSFAFSFLLSIGDFGIIAFFGNDGILTLPYYLYELLGTYRENEASFVAFVLLLLTIIIFVFFDEKEENDRAEES